MSPPVRTVTIIAGIIALGMGLAYVALAAVPFIQNAQMEAAAEERSAQQAKADRAELAAQEARRQRYQNEERADLERQQRDTPPWGQTDQLYILSTKRPAWWRHRTETPPR